MRNHAEAPDNETAELSTREKALRINLDSLRYGTFAGIAAGNRSQGATQFR
jgi:hypothetical protein